MYSGFLRKARRAKISSHSTHPFLWIMLWNLDCQMSPLTTLNQSLQGYYYSLRNSHGQMSSSRLWYRSSIVQGVRFSKEWTTNLTTETWKSLEAGSIFRDWYENYEYVSKVRNWGHLYEGTSYEMLIPGMPIIWFWGSCLLHFSGF